MSKNRCFESHLNFGVITGKKLCKHILKVEMFCSDLTYYKTMLLLYCCHVLLWVCCHFCVYFRTERLKRAALRPNTHHWRGSSHYQRHDVYIQWQRNAPSLLVCHSCTFWSVHDKGAYVFTSLLSLNSAILKSSGVLTVLWGNENFLVTFGVHKQPSIHTIENTTIFAMLVW